MPVTLDNLIYATRLRLGDYVQEGYDTASGDSETDRFVLSHTNLLENSCTILVDGLADLTASVDELSGWVSFTTVPGPPAGDEPNITFSYQYTVWSEERIIEALNSAIQEKFGAYYLTAVNDAIVSDGEAELVAQTSAGVDLDVEDRIVKVDYWNEERWVRYDGWRIDVQDDQKVIIFEQAPRLDLQLRITYHSRPGTLTEPTDTLETTAGIPTRFKEPLVLLACSDLVTDRIHHRIRDDRGHNTQGENPVKSYEIQNDAQFLRAQAEIKFGRLKMPPLRTRVSF